MFNRVWLGFMFVAVLVAAGLGMSSKSIAQGCGGYGNYVTGGYGYGPSYPAYYGNGGYGYGASYPAYYGNGYGSGFYGHGPSVSLYRGYGNGGHYGGHGHYAHSGAHFSIGF